MHDHVVDIQKKKWLEVADENLDWIILNFLEK